MCRNIQSVEYKRQWQSCVSRVHDMLYVAVSFMCISELGVRRTRKAQKLNILNPIKNEQSPNKCVLLFSVAFRYSKPTSFCSRTRIVKRE